MVELDARQAKETMASIEHLAQVLKHSSHAANYMRLAA
jgi:hypothetical protein